MHANAHRLEPTTDLSTPASLSLHSSCSSSPSFAPRSSATGVTTPASALEGVTGGDDDAQWGFATRAIHVGSEASKETGAVIPGISLSTTYKQTRVGKHMGFEYSRSSNPNRAAFESLVASLEEGEHGFAFASGSAATATVVQALCAPTADGKRAHVVSVADVYGGTHRYFTKVATQLQQVETTFLDIDGDVEAALKAVIRPETKLVWLESPTNPTLRIAPISQIASAVHAHDPSILVVVDNTFLSPYYQQPLRLGADIVSHSVTKYLNGHSDVVMGALVTRRGLSNDVVERLRFLQNAHGAVPSPHDAWLAQRGLKTLAVRMREHGHNALLVSRFLSSHPGVRKVIYPGLPSHPGFETAKAQLAERARKDLQRVGGAVRSGETAEDGAFPYGGMVTFRLDEGEEDPVRADRFLASLKIFTLAESLGGVESLAELPSLMTHGGLSNAERKKLGIEHNLIRLSVGIEDAEDLIADLAQALDKAHK